MKLSNLYARLGLLRSATQADIKNAYFNLSKLYHPDKNDGCRNSAHKFREITEAYEILRNPTTRRKYDRELPFDGHKDSETRTPRKKPSRTYDYADKFSERDPEFEAKIRFYRQYWREKSKRPQNAHYRSRVYNFDAWFSAHYGNTFEGGWYYSESTKKSNSNNNERAYDDFENISAWNFNQEKPARPSRDASKTSPFDFEHIYTNPIEYTIRRQKSEKIYEIMNITALIFLLFGIMVSVAFIIENANLDKYKFSGKNADGKRDVIEKKVSGT